MFCCFLFSYTSCKVISFAGSLMLLMGKFLFFFFFQAEDGIRDIGVTGVQTCALPIYHLRLDEIKLFCLSLDNHFFYTIHRLHVKAHFIEHAPHFTIAAHHILCLDYSVLPFIPCLTFTATPLRYCFISFDGNIATPTAITLGLLVSLPPIILFPVMIATSDPTFIFEPDHSTCLQKSDRPSLTNGTASCIGLTQFSQNRLLFSSKYWAPMIVSASPPSVRNVMASLPPIPKFFILPVRLEKLNWMSSGRASETPAPNIASTCLHTFSLGSIGKGF